MKRAPILVLLLTATVAVPGTSFAQRSVRLAVTPVRAAAVDSSPRQNVVQYVAHTTAVGGVIGAAFGTVAGFVFHNLVKERGITVAQGTSSESSPPGHGAAYHAVRGAGVGLILGSMMGYGYARTVLERRSQSEPQGR